LKITKTTQDIAKDLYRDGVEKEARQKAESLNMPYADLSKVTSKSEVLSLLSKEEVIKYKVLPLSLDNKKLYIGVTNPSFDISKLKTDLVEDYRLKEVVTVIISDASYVDGLSLYENIRKQASHNERDEFIDLTETTSAPTFEELNKQLQEAPIQDLLNMILLMGFNSKASDVHVEPHNDHTIIRMRLDGVLHEVANLPKERYSYILSQVELHSNLKLNADYPQNGRFSIKIADQDLGVRIETMPSMHGDDIVMRLFNTQSKMLDLDGLGLSEYAKPILESSLMRPHGMIIMVGPTGSGKTTTIYAILNKLNSENVKIITLEDPIEYEMEGVTQSQINEGETFADRLKAVLREDPDIIMVGEIREASTAQVALQAALTGHLMVSTIHANDAVTAIIRLTEMIGDANLVTASTNVIIAQRLVRKICPKCRAAYAPTEYELAELNKIMAKMKDEIKPTEPYNFFRGNGCDDCHGIGFKGRIGIYELLEIDKNLQKLINEGVPIFEVQEAALAGGLVTMEQDGILKALDGITTLTEVLKTIRE